LYKVVIVYNPKELFDILTSFKFFILEIAFDNHTPALSLSLHLLKYKISILLFFYII